MKLAVILGNPKKNLMSRMTSIFTKCPAYHVAWVDLEENLMYDMSWLRRRRVWPQYIDQEVVLYDFPIVTKEYLEHKLSTDNSDYGFVDFVLFALRPIYHLFGKSTRNASGVICSEMVNNDIIACGGTTPFDPVNAPPSPCDIYKWVLTIQ
jgi:hypothetical protein